MVKIALTVSKQALLELDYVELAPNIREILHISDLLNLPIFREDRANCETDEGLVQLIPYVTVVNSEGKILSYRRGSSSGENRLLSKHSIGIGGHIEEQFNIWALDRLDEVSSAIAFSALKELHEEIGFPLEYVTLCNLKGKLKMSEVIVMYSTLDNVDRFHLCLAMQITLEDPNLVLEEGHIEDIKWSTKEELLEEHNSQERILEGWSETLLKYLYE